MPKNYYFIIIFLLILGYLWNCGNDTNQTTPKAYVFKDVSELPVLPGLPDLFIMADGSRVKTKEDWLKQRDYLKKMLAYYQYGTWPPKPDDMSVQTTSKDTLSGAAIKEIVLINVNRKGKTFSFRCGWIRPLSEGRFPVIIKNDIFLFDSTDIKDKEKRAKYYKSRRFETQDFVNQEAMKRRYVIAKFIRTDIAADHRDNRDSGVFPLYPDYDFGTIAAWAWAYSVIMDILQETAFADMDKVVVTGHSRGGKTALCAGIYEERIAITAPNSSGSGGTGSWRYFDPAQKAQVIAVHNPLRTYWWTPPLFQFAGLEERMPFDAHTAKALIAPRVLINIHARHDYWANPYGTYLTYLAAQPVFDWWGVSGHQAIHWRDGKHNQLVEDWQALFDFCDWIFFQKKTDRVFNDNPHPDLYTFEPFPVPGHKE